MTSNPYEDTNLFFANKDDMELKPLNIVEDSVLVPETPTIPSPPLTSFNASFNMPKKKNLDFLFWQDRPSSLKYPNKKRKWRVRKKWFNRYEKPRYIGSEVMIEGNIAIISNVTILKHKGRFASFKFDATLP